MTKFTDLRDGGAYNAIRSNGALYTLRQESGAFTPATGANALTNNDTPVYAVYLSLSSLLKGAGGRQQFREEMIEQWDHGLLMEAKSLHDAGKTISANDVLMVGTSMFARIVWIDPVQPDGNPIIYKVAVARL